MVRPRVIGCQQFSDTRGQLIAFNDFNMAEIVRCYEILPSSENVIRAWQAHKEEKKWFYCSAGSILVNLIKLDDFDAPSEDLEPIKFHLQSDKPEVLEIPGGFANGFKALGPNSRLMVFSNFTLRQSATDDYRYLPGHWEVRWELEA